MILSKIITFIIIMKEKSIRLYEEIFLYYISKNEAVYFKGKVRLKGIPLIDIRKDAKLIIGDNVMLASRNKGYHLNMHSAVKLMADRKDAVISIGDNTRIHGTCVHAYTSITIGENCLIAGNCQIIDGNGHSLSFSNVKNRINTNGYSKAIIIENNVWIGANSIILPGVRIGNGSIISANSVVNKDIPDMVIAGGNPAIVIKKY